MTQLSTAPSQGNVPLPAPAKPLRRRRDWFPFWLILPTVLVLLAVQVYPALYTVMLSVQERQRAGWFFVGFKNFAKLLNSSLFAESVGHTIIFLIGYVVLTLFLGFIIALLLNAKSMFSGFYMTPPSRGSAGFPSRPRRPWCT